MSYSHKMILFLYCICITSCALQPLPNSSTVLPTGTSDISPATGMPGLTPGSTLIPDSSIQYLRNLNLLLSNTPNSAISPDCHWLFSQNTRTKIEVFSIREPNQKFELKPKDVGATTSGVISALWAPDGSAIALYEAYPSKSSDRSELGGNFIIIADLSNSRSVKESLFKWKDKYLPELLWSPDGTKIYIGLGPKYSSWILGRRGDVIAEIPLNDQFIISSPAWMGERLYFINNKSSGNSELWVIELRNDKTEKIYTFDGLVSIIGFNNKTDQLLLLRMDEIVRFQIFDLQLNIITDNFDTDFSANESYYPVLSPEQYAGINKANFGFFVFDWATHKIINAGDNVSANGWCPPVNGFLVHELNPNKEELSVFVP